MTRRGRRHKPGTRTPAGRLSRALAEVGEQHPTEWARIRDNAIAQARHPDLGTELGRLFFHNRIKATEFEAGRKYGHVVSSSLRRLGFRLVDPGDPSPPGGGRMPEPGTDEWDELVKRGGEIGQDLRFIRGIIPTKPERIAVEAVCVTNSPCAGHEQFFALVTGLRAVAAYFDALARNRHAS